MRANEFITEGVAGPKNCWPGYRKTGTQPGTGKNKGKRVNDCEKIKKNNESKIQELSADTLKSYKDKAFDRQHALISGGLGQSFDSDDMDAWSKRNRGIDRAYKKLDKIKDTDKKNNKTKITNKRV